jgi:hypothetical protein
VLPWKGPIFVSYLIPDSDLIMTNILLCMFLCILVSNIYYIVNYLILIWQYVQECFGG